MAKAKTPKKAVAKRKQAGKQRGLTDLRRKAILGQVRTHGCYARAYEALGIPHSTFYLWLEAHPDFHDELRAATAEVDARVGQKARHALEGHFDDVLSRATVRRTREAPIAVAGGGQEVVTLVEEEPVELNPALVRTALTKLDRAWTHPEATMRVEGTVVVETTAERMKRVARQELEAAGVIESTAEVIDVTPTR